MPEDNILVGARTPIPFDASVASKVRVTKGDGATVYYKNESNVSSVSNDGSLTTTGQSETFTAPTWFISTSAKAKIFVERIPSPSTDMATQAEMEAIVGSGTLAVNKGADNVAIGNEALASNTTGKRNTAIGAEALATVTIADESVAVGYKALLTFKEGTTGTEGFNVAVGSRALTALTKGQGNVAVGYIAGDALTTGDENVVIGCEALNKQTTVNATVAIGFRALNDNTTGEANTVVGYQAAAANTTGHHNVVLGHEALLSNLEGFQNIAIGAGALGKCTDNDNLAIGGVALKELTTGTHNIAIGQNAIEKIKAGNNNVALGSGAGYHATEGSKENLFLGMEAGPTVDGVVNTKLYIHNEPSDEPLVWGDFAAKELRLYTTKLGFFGAPPAARPNIKPAGEATTAEVAEALYTLGLVE